MQDQVKSNDEKVHNPLLQQVLLALNIKYKAYLTALNASTQNKGNQDFAVAAQKKYAEYQDRIKEIKGFVRL